MSDIFNVSTLIHISVSEKKDEKALLIRINQRKDGFQKKNGDIFLTQENGDSVLNVYASDVKNADGWRVVGGKIAAWLREFQPASAHLEMGDAQAEPLIEGLFLGAYQFVKYKTGEGQKTIPELTLNADEKIFGKVKTICDSANMAREWAQEPAFVINPWTLSDRAVAFSEQYGLKCTILDDKKLMEMGAGAIVAVGQGSKTPSRMIILEYAGTSGEKPVALVGKAITFDSGGYSIKPSEHIQGMKYDKSGAMAVFGVLRAAALLKLSQPIVGVICAAENMLSDHSYLPDDILTSLSGKTIEIITTDAEGRLVLADGLTYAQNNFSPACVIDYATLTGGCLVALGNVRAGIMCNDDALFEQLYNAGERTHERLWRMPMDEDYSLMIKGKDADIKNSGGKNASTVTAGMFLKEFVKDDQPWAHIDIAGTADDPKGRAYFASGSTGFGVRLTIDYLMEKEKNRF